MEHTPHNLIDSHFHLLAMQAKGIDLTHILTTMEQLDMQGIDIGISATDLAQRAILLKDYPFIHLSSGIGPWGVERGQPPLQQQLENLHASLSQHKVCAIGEIGLDNHWGYGTQKSQADLFALQMDLAEQLGLPIIIHSREADKQMIDMLQGRSFSQRGIMHCYQGSHALAKLAIDKGMFISFAGPLTYKSNNEMREIFKAVPAGHLLLETDSPYLSPVPHRGKLNTPLNMVHIYQYAATIRKTSMEELIDQIKANFSLFLS